MTNINETNENCVFCKIIAGKIPATKIWEDEEYFIMLDVNPRNPGHTLVIPKKHDNYLFDLNDKEYSELMLKAKEVSKILKERLNPKRVGLVVEGFGVPHVHIHLIPINKADELGKEKMRNIGSDELNKIAKLIRGK